MLTWHEIPRLLDESREGPGLETARKVVSFSIFIANRRSKND